VQLDDDSYKSGKGHASAHLDTSPRKVARIFMRPGFLEELERRGDTMLAELEQVMHSANAMFSKENVEHVGKALQSFQATMDAYAKVAQSVDPAMKKLPQVMDNLNGTLSSTRTLAQQLADPNGALQTTLNGVGKNMQSATESVQGAASTLSTETLPQLNGFARDARQTVRSADRAINKFGSKPQSVLFGPDPAPPGPGEAGFTAPAP
jgi:phospholipid/cholesterol/gamma-HCH transport system substrate-binding protein